MSYVRPCHRCGAWNARQARICDGCDATLPYLVPSYGPARRGAGLRRRWAQLRSRLPRRLSI